MKKIIPPLLLSLISTFAFAEDTNGFFIGGGPIATIDDDCHYCDTYGFMLEAGYNFNKIIGIEAKLGETEYEDNSDIQNDITYVGLNVGHTLNLSWMRLYGKVGHIKIEETDSYWGDSYSDSGLAFGLGITFTPFAHQSGLYFKVESMSADLFDTTISYGQIAAGFQF